jgi:hypothetical protein
MKCLATLTLAALPIFGSCGGGAREQRVSAVPKLLHSPELNEIMKNEVNQPFSALMFLVFHGEEASESGELDFERIAAPVTTLRTGVTKVKAMANPPVQTAEAKEVFLAYVDSLARDSDQLYQAFEGRDRPRMQQVLQKITQTCNDCHHFFRLKVVAEGPPPPPLVMVQPAYSFLP